MKMIVERDAELYRRAQRASISGLGLLMRLVDDPSPAATPVTTYQMQKWEAHPDGTMTIIWERVWWEL